MSASIALASPTFQNVETVDFGTVGTKNTTPLYTPDDIGSATRLLAYPSDTGGFLTFHDGSETSDLLPRGTVDASDALFYSTVGVVKIDAGQIEAIDGWTGLLETPVGWRTPSEQSTPDAQRGFFMATVPDPASAELPSYVSVIPLPGALASAGITIGLIGAAWVFRRFKATRPTH